MRSVSTVSQTSSKSARRPISEAAAEFLACRRIAVTGVSRKPEGHGANVVYQRLRERGYQVFAVNPNAGEVEGDRCYPDLRSIPGGVEAVVIATRPETAPSTMRECAELGIKQVWMHRSFGGGSVSDVAADYGRQAGISVIPGGCPLMFDPVSDGGHKGIRFILHPGRHRPANRLGAVPQPLGTAGRPGGGGE
jgi:predicted CoA-binding protein